MSLGKIPERLKLAHQKNDDSCGNLLYKFAEDTKLSRSSIYGLETELGPLENACLEAAGGIWTVKTTGKNCFMTGKNY